jgi:Ca2+-binding EF-hand superfamily protein
VWDYSSQINGTGNQNSRLLFGHKGFESKYLEPREFREQVFRSFHVRLENQEISALVTLLDTAGDGTIDTIAFLNEVNRLGKRERQIQISKKNKDNNSISLRRMNRIEKCLADALIRTHKQIPSEWTIDDEHSAVMKITKAASVYDSNKVGGLQGFMETGYLNATEFSEQLRQNMGITLTKRETAAIMGIFDSDGYTPMPQVYNITST